ECTTTSMISSSKEPTTKPPKRWFLDSCSMALWRLTTLPRKANTMTTTAQRPQSSRLPAGSRKLSLSDTVTSGNKLPSRVVLHGVEGIGKTSFAAAAPNPYFLMARGETGLETLIDAGQVKEIPHAPELQTWNEVLDIVEALRTEDHS